MYAYLRLGKAGCAAFFSAVVVACCFLSVFFSTADQSIWDGWGLSKRYILVDVLGARNLPPAAQPRRPYVTTSTWWWGTPPREGWAGTDVHESSVYTDANTSLSPVWGSNVLVFTIEGTGCRFIRVTVLDAGASVGAVSIPTNGSDVDGWLPLTADGRDAGEVRVRTSRRVGDGASTYCEPVLESGAVAQPINTWSNLGFVVSGLHMALLGASDFRHHSAVFSVLNGALQIYAGVGSFLYHASLTALAQQLDVASMYMLLVCPSVYMLQRLGLMGNAVLVLIVSVCATLLSIYKWDIDGNVASSGKMVPALVGVMLALICAWLAVVRPRVTWHLAGGAVVSIAVAWTARTLDVEGRYCARHSAYQGHAVWHIFTAFSLWLLYAFLRSEDTSEEAQLANITVHRRSRSDNCALRRVEGLPKHARSVSF